MFWSKLKFRSNTKGTSPKRQDMADRLGKLDHLVIPADLEFERLTSLSYEGRQKLTDTQALAHWAKLPEFLVSALRT